MFIQGFNCRKVASGEAHGNLSFHLQPIFCHCLTTIYMLTTKVILNYYMKPHALSILFVGWHHLGERRSISYDYNHDLSCTIFGPVRLEFTLKLNVCIGSLSNIYTTQNYSRSTFPLLVHIFSFIL